MVRFGRVTFVKEAWNYYMDLSKNHDEIICLSSISVLLNEAKKEVKWLVDGLIEDDRERGHQWLITGEPKAGKSRLAMQLAISVAEGNGFIGFNSTSRKRVLYFNFELSKRVAACRALEFFGGDERRMKECEKHLFIVSEWASVDVLDSQQADYIRGLVEKVDPDFIVWDVMKRMSNAEENNNVEMSNVMQTIRKISSRRTHVVVHHSRKEQHDRNAGARGIRGASSIHAEVDGVISIAEIGAKHTLQFSTRSISDLDGMALISNGVCFERGEATRGNKAEAKKVDVSQAFATSEWVSRKVLLALIKDQIGVKEAAADRRIGELVDKGVLLSELKGKEKFYSLNKK